MSTASPSSLRIVAPAKLNLGLEVIGRRADGYHDLVTILVAIDLRDELQLAPSRSMSMRSSIAGLADEENLALQALRLLKRTTGVRKGAELILTKSIPAASGLGGASSDAAAALIAGRALWRLSVSDESLAGMAALLGSDVPFFLRGGCSMARGRGELLEPLPLPRDVWFVVAVPNIAIPRKTATLFAGLKPPDFSDGSRVLAQARRMAAGLPMDPSLLGNAFARALYDLAPRLSKLPDIMKASGAEVVALSGAGPAHYAPFAEGEGAKTAARRLRGELGDTARVFVTRPDAERPALSRPL